MRSLSRKALALFVIVLTLAMAVGASAAPSHPSVEIQLINISDWHGQLDPLAVGATQVGGAATLSTYFKNERLANPNTLILTAGDAVGATPPLSSFFADVPTIKAMNLMGVQVDTLGNHNFDGGLVRLQSQIDLANFDYVSANLENRDANISGVEDFQIYNVGGVNIAVIGLTNPEAPTLVFPGNFGTIVPTDPVKAALQARGAAKDAGADIVIVIAHMGVTGFDAGVPYGPLIDFAKAVNKDDKKNPKIDVIIGDHTDIQFSGIINGALVYENRSKGLTYARATLTVDAENHKILNQSVTFVTPLVSAVTPDPDVVAMLLPYRTAIAPILSVIIGESTIAIPRSDKCGQSAGRTCESLIGNVTTDALRTRYGVDFAITNSGGLRTSLTCPGASTTDFCPLYSPPNFKISRGKALAVLPFGNVVVTLSVNGAELKSMLENGVSAMPGANGRFAQVSGLCFAYDIAAPVGSRVTGAVRQAANGSCTGAAVDLTAASTYLIAENDFMANGGDGYPFFAPRMVTREIMEQVLADYITANSPITPTLQNRIVCTDSNGASAPNCPLILP